MCVVSNYSKSSELCGPELTGCRRGGAPAELQSVQVDELQRMGLQQFWRPHPCPHTIKVQIKLKKGRTNIF